MDNLSHRVNSSSTGTYLRLAIILFLAIVLYIFKFSALWLTALIAANGYLSDNRNEAIATGAILGYTIHLAVIISNAISYHHGASVGIGLVLLPMIGAIAGVVLSGLAYAIKQRNVFWVLVIAIVAAGFPIWITSYHQFTNSKVPLLLSLILLAVVACVTTVHTEFKRGSIIFVMTVSFLIALFIKFYIDSLEDPTSHNLLPFELGLELMGGVLFTAIGFACGLAFKQKYRKDEFE